MKYTYDYNSPREGVKAWWQITPDELGPDEHWPRSVDGSSFCGAAVKKSFWSPVDNDFKDGWVQCSNKVVQVNFCASHAARVFNESDPPTVIADSLHVGRRYDSELERELNRLASLNSVRLDPSEASAHYGREFAQSWDASTDVSSAIREYRTEIRDGLVMAYSQREDLKQWPWTYAHTRPPRKLRRYINESKPR